MSILISPTRPSGRHRAPSRAAVALVLVLLTLVHVFDGAVSLVRRHPQELRRLAVTIVSADLFLLSAFCWVWSR